MMTAEFNELLSCIESEGALFDAHETEHSRRFLNLERPTAELLSVLLTASRSKRVLEVGTSNGYSTVWIAWTISHRGGNLMTLERSAEKQDKARANVAEAGLLEHVEFRCGDATELISRMEGSFDAIFFDADRWSAHSQLELMLPHLDRHCLLMADNALSHPEELAGYLSFVAELPDFISTVVPVGKGLSVATRA